MHEELRTLLFTIHYTVHMAPAMYTLYQEIAYLKRLELDQNS
jgi:hypothetical protein